MLLKNQIYDVDVVSVEKFLTGHYNPLSKTINSSTNTSVFWSICIHNRALAIIEWLKKTNS